MVNTVISIFFSLFLGIFLVGKSPSSLPQLWVESMFPPSLVKPDELPPSTFQTIYITFLIRS